MGFALGISLLTVMRRMRIGHRLYHPARLPIVSDGDLFYEEYMRKREGEIKSEVHRAFLAGYYSHLITDAVFQKFIRDENRVKAVWRRIYADEQLREKVKCYPEDWNSVRIIIPKVLVNKYVGIASQHY